MAATLVTEAKAKVLVVDDEPSILASIADLLEFEFDVVTFTDPVRALERLESEEFSVIISDLRMPRMNGDEFLHLAKERSGATRVLLTGFADIDALGRVVNEGKIYAYVTKPWDPLMLRTNIRNAAREYRLLNILHYERDLLRTLVDNLPDCVHVQDLQQRYTLVNQAFARLAGMDDPREATGKTELECLPGEFGRNASADAQTVLETGLPVISECHEWKQSNGAPRWYSSTLVPVRNPIDRRIVGLVGILIDITQQKQIENYLRSAKETAEATVRAKHEFLARISHEIRTPLNSILGMAELLAETELSGKQRKFVDVFRRSGDLLLRLLNDILDLSRSDRNELRLDTVNFDLRDVVHGTLESLQRSAAIHGIALTCEVAANVPNALTGDAGRLKQVLTNLVNNSLKFTPNGRIQVNVEYTQVDDGEVLLEFAVEDTGIGIPPDKLDTIFKPFGQAEQFITSKYGGSGLGLTICEQLVHQMGGKIWVQSTLGAGSVFRFTAGCGLAAAPPPAIAPIERKLTKDSLASLKMLVAEDNQDNVVLLQAYMGPVQMEVAANGREAVDKFAAGEFDIVLMDLQMPEMDGLEATRLIREWEHEHQKAPTPIVACTAHGDIGGESLEAGCTGHLTKPICRETLFAAVAACVGE